MVLEKPAAAIRDANVGQEIRMRALEGHRLPHTARSAMNQTAEGGRCCCSKPARAPSFPVLFVRSRKAHAAPLLCLGQHSDVLTRKKATPSTAIEAPSRQFLPSFRSKKSEAELVIWMLI